MNVLTVFLITLFPFISLLAHADNQAPRSFWDWSTEWSEKKFIKQAKKHDKAVSKRQWKKSIELGETALEGCLTLYHPLDQRCIIIMKNNVTAYARTQQTLSHRTEITQAYQAATEAVGKKHFSTIIIRDIYRAMLLDLERYEDAVPVFIESIEVERAMQNDEFKILNYEIYLYALYLVTEQPQYEEPTLLRMMALTEKIMGVESDDFYRMVSTLAETYCARKQYNEFFDVIGKYKLDTKCLSKDQHTSS
ncbi:hypothetical protein [Oceanicoccus sagamiensis]|uniref:Tetratricopeptide repeat protein n=1 Tax=Oceanicoccus sagamiensis TaxID=716816 RepID=A0A1X9NCS7_9GAMM|nr:hypothetical protein [Oceanicoccus sagamiensis]ARN72767.1 hypothetical protein BST96_00740 [Oceanicoccus sagamiensis]